MNNNCQFFVGHICPGKFTFIEIGFWKKKEIFLIIKNQSSYLL